MRPTSTGNTERNKRAELKNRKNKRRSRSKAIEQASENLKINKIKKEICRLNRPGPKIKVYTIPDSEIKQYVDNLIIFKN